MKAITQRESVVTYICISLIFQIPRLMLISKHRVISPLSDGHSLIFGILKLKCPKLSAKEICYRSFKNFNNNNF